MQYKGIDLIKIIEPQIFDPPKRMLVWNENDREPRIDTIYAIGPSSMLSPVRAISDDGRLGTHCYECCADIPKSRRATHRELSKWLAQGNGERIDKHGKCIFTDFGYMQHDEAAFVEDIFLIRKWDDKEWHEPTVDYMGIEEV